MMLQADSDSDQSTIESLSDLSDQPSYSGLDVQNVIKPIESEKLTKAYNSQGNYSIKQANSALIPAKSKHWLIAFLVPSCALIIFGL